PSLPPLSPPSLHDALPNSLVPLDDRARMSHPLSGRRRATGHVRHDPFRHVPPDELRGVLLRGPADLADEDDSLRPSVALKETKGDRKSTRLNSSHVSISYA